MEKLKKRKSKIEDDQTKRFSTHSIFTEGKENIEEELNDEDAHITEEEVQDNIGIQESFTPEKPLSVSPNFQKKRESLDDSALK